jgi:3-deoxy-D-manno-octulosonic-acid transferase
MGLLGHGLAALGAVALLPAVLVALALRPGWRVGWRERLGAHPPAAPGAVWIHGASVGEMRAAALLVERLRVRGEAVTVSATTTTGRDLLRRLCPDVPCALAPLDHPWCVGRALRRVRPSLLVLVETELWPALIRGADARGTPVVVVSGRLSERSFPRYRRLGPLLRPVLRRLRAVGARSAEDAERFVALGVPAARVSVTGDLKQGAPGAASPLSADLDAVLGDVPLVVAGSTHEGEESAALQALAQAERAGLRAALVLAPRRPERFDEVVRQARESGRRVLRRSALPAESLAAGDVLVLDSLGELASLWTRADVAFVGGSLAPRGGHNLLEPAAAGRAVLFGPHTASARDAAELLLAADAALRVPDVAALAAGVCEALRDPAQWARRGARAAAVVAAGSGVAERSAAFVLAARAEAARAPEASARSALSP